MSRYMINKLMWEVEASDEALASFKADTPGFLDRWAAEPPRPPYPRGGALTSEERTAFERWDYAALYAMGAHPFLLWQFTKAVLVPEQMTAEELMKAYRAAVEQLGHPEFDT
jgi:hypothetical protein